MAITTLDQAIAGMQPSRLFEKAITNTPTAGRPMSLWMLGGIPGAGAQDVSGSSNGTVLSSTSALVPGQLPFYNPGSGNTYLARFLWVTGHCQVALAV